MKYSLSIILFLGISWSLIAQDVVDQEAVKKIRKEGLENSQVMDIAFNLTDVSGPRLQGSPGFKKAANYAQGKLKEWGLENIQYEAWGEFGKGWEVQKSYVAMTAPYYKPIIGLPKVWVAGTNGPKVAEVLLIAEDDTSGLVAYKGQFKDKVVMLWSNNKVASAFNPDAKRYTDEQLEEMAKAEIQAGSIQGQSRTENADFREMIANMRKLSYVSNKTKEMAKAEGAVAFFSIGMKGKDGTVFVTGGGSYKAGDPENMLDLVIGTEDYLTISRLVKAGVPVKLEVDVKTRFLTDDLKGYNVIAEIKGTDPKLKDEVVMLGAHLDSWHTGTGATDNAAGSSVMMEAVRILKASGLKPKRTIRLALWSAEEQGLHGSRNYVKNHLTDTSKQWSNAAGDKVSAYYNLDNGTGKIRGIYLQENEGARSIFSKWLEPFHDLDAKTVTIRNTGSTDHVAFDRVGIPGFQFIQDPMEYSTRTHHSNMDTYDHLSGDDLKQAATIVASFVYHTAQRDQKIPRKPKKD